MFHVEHCLRQVIGFFAIIIYFYLKLAKKKLRKILIY